MPDSFNAVYVQKILLKFGEKKTKNFLTDICIKNLFFLYYYTTIVFIHILFFI